MLPKEELIFGATFTDHMLRCPWDKSTGWADPAIVPFGPMEMNPASAVLHYAIEVGVHRLELRCDLHAAPAARG